MLLKSINIVSDIRDPARIAHYRPTRKSLKTVRAVAGLDGSQATAVIAAYGTGKSIAATVGGLVTEAAPNKLEGIRGVLDRIAKLDPDLLESTQDRSRSHNRGLVIALSGHVPNMPNEISPTSNGTTAKSLSTAIEELEAALRSSRADRVAIIWDEFGRHLEHLAAAGTAEELLAVQELAEWVVRRKRPSTTLTILLHQDFQQYAGRLGQTEQDVWRKIEGRFETVRMLEDSDEIFDLLADIACEFRPWSPERAIGRRQVAAARRLDLFPFLSTAGQVRDFLTRALPIMPSVLYLLPRIAGRIGQSERTAIGFISEMVLGSAKDTPVSIEDLYGYFADAMRSDIAPGGTHRRYVEVESARSRCKNAIEKETIAAVALAQLGGSTERTRVGRRQLADLMTVGSTHPEKSVDEAIGSLLSRKLLLHRNLTDDISVWHGSDIDVRGLAAEIVESLRASGNIISRLQELVPATHSTAPQYNFQHSITRYALGRYALLSDLSSPERLAEFERLGNEHDAVVLTVVDGSNADLGCIDRSFFEKREHLVVALPKVRPDLDRPCLNALALMELHNDDVLLETDPLVEREISELLGNALDTLHSRTARILEPAAGAVCWHSGEAVYGSDGAFNSGEVLSGIFSRRFSKTPRITNEQLVRRSVTSTTRSARKRLLLGILERTHMCSLGYLDSTAADASMFRTVLVQTGLYDAEAGTWVDANDQRLDPELAEIWGVVRDFFALPTRQPKSFASLTSLLAAPPYGIRQGLFPILIAAGLRAYGKCLAIRMNSGSRWTYVDDVQPSVIEKIANAPEVFEAEVLDLGKQQLVVLEAMIAEFAAAPDQVETDLIRAFHDALMSWRRDLPSAALTTQTLEPEASRFQILIRSSGNDPVNFLMRGLPALAGGEPLSHVSLEFLNKARMQLESVAERYVAEAIKIARRAFSLGYGDERSDLVSTASRWMEDIPSGILKDPSLDSVSKGIVKRVQTSASRCETDVSLVRALSMMLMGSDFRDWDDATTRRFAREMRSRVREIEDAAAGLDGVGAETTVFLERRIGAYFNKYARAVGRDVAMNKLQSLQRSVR